MESIETAVFEEPGDADQRLAHLELDREALVRVGDAALSARNDVTPLFCANSAGTLAYHYGTYASRSEYVGRGWLIDRTHGVEAIKNSNNGQRVVFQSVDVACSIDCYPKPRSPKGSGSERLAQGNLFNKLPSFFLEDMTNQSVYYLMVDENGAIELTKATIRGATFADFVERIFLRNGLPIDPSPDTDETCGDSDFEVEIQRR